MAPRPAVVSTPPGHQSGEAEDGQHPSAPHESPGTSPLTSESITLDIGRILAQAKSGLEAGQEVDWAALYHAFDAVEIRVRSEGSRRRYRWTQDTRDAAAEERLREFREKLLPAFEAAASKFTEFFARSEAKAQLDVAYGPQLSRILRTEQIGLDPTNADLRLLERRLSSDYDRLVASAQVEVGGVGVSLAQARSMAGSADPNLRKEAWNAWRGWHLAERDVLARNFDELVAARHAMAQRLDEPNFIPLGYASMTRTEFGPSQSEAFRDAVEAHAVPLLRRLRKEQARALGCDTLRPWDVAFHPEVSLPDGAAQPVSSQLERAQGMFERLSPDLATRFRFMRENDLIDLENRPGKGAGAYCAAFHDESKVVIFCNSVGDEGDIRTLTHEMGHAFQCWESQWISPVKMRWPTMDAAEIHSMGMEYLVLPYVDEFFDPSEAERFAVGRWRRGVELLCYVACVDAFQHWVYEHPQATAGDRDAQWIALQDRFDAGVDWSGEAAPFAATRWYAQLHIFRYPFYYIDYALAELGAMQLAQASSQNQEAALNSYIDLCRLGGTKSMLELVAEVGLDSPFEEALLARLMQHAAGVLAPAP